MYLASYPDEPIYHVSNVTCCVTTLPVNTAQPHMCNDRIQTTPKSQQVPLVTAYSVLDITLLHSNVTISVLVCNVFAFMCHIIIGAKKYMSIMVSFP